jgi:hypothetical protein
MLHASLVLLAALAVAPAPALAPPPAPPALQSAQSALAELSRASARLAPARLTVDLSRLSPGDRGAVARLVEAARVMDALFLRQVWAGNGALLAELAADPSPLGRARLQAFLTFKGPWDRLDDDRPFIPGVPKKPAQAGFYPADTTREELERWEAGLPAEAREEATGFFTVVRRRPDGKLSAVPYAQEYQGELGRAAALLEDAARLTGDPSLRAFLQARAKAFATNAYRDSDVAWMRVDGPVEATIGPYETYEDGWFNAKAAFEAVVGVRDEAFTARLAHLSAELQGIEDALPIDANLKNPRLGGLSPIRVVDVVYVAGDAAQGVQMAAYNLPNDEWVQRTMGSKRVMLKNIQEAKFEKVLRPISKVALAPAERARVAFEPFFTHIIMHELVHGLGPSEAVAPDGRRTTVRAALADSSPALEEAKADVGGLFALLLLVDEGKLPADLTRTLFPTMLCDGLRSIRFGLSEAHGKAWALQLSWYLDHGGIRARPDGTLTVDPAKMREAVTSLTHEIMTVQGRGDRARAEALLARMGTIRPEIQRILERLAGVPVDIAPRFATASSGADAPDQPAQHR